LSTFNGLAFVESAFHRRWWVSVREFLLENRIDRRQVLGTLLHEVLDVLVLHQCLGQGFARIGAAQQFHVRIDVHVFMTIAEKVFGGGLPTHRVQVLREPRGHPIAILGVTNLATPLAGILPWT
jgi:hypothetical protein